MIKEVVNKYNSLSLPIKSSFWFLICAFFQRGITFITTPVFTRLLSTSEYGQLNVFNAWHSILAVIISLNLSAGVYSSGMVKFEGERKVFSSALQGLTLVLALVWFGIYFLFRDLWNCLFSLTTIQMVMMFIIIWETSVFCFWSVEQRVEFKYRKLVIVTCVVSIAIPILGIIFVLDTNDKVTARIFSIVLVQAAVYSWFFFSQMFRGKKFFSAKFWKHALNFNIPLIPHYLSMMVLTSVDRIMISRITGESSAGIYSLAYSLSQIMTMFNTALLQTAEPWLYQKIRDKKISEIGKVAYPAFALIALVNLILIALAPEIVSLFAPKAYRNAIWVIPPVAMSVFFMFSYTFFAVFEFYYEKTKWIALATGVGAVLNIVLNYIFIGVFDYYAAGYTTLVCYMVYALAHFIFMRRVCRKYLENARPYNAKIYFAIAGIFILVGFTLLFSYYHMGLRYMLIVAMAVGMFIKRNKLIKMVKI